MPPGREDLLQRIYELERDNNRMLHAMRRNSFLGGILRFVLWVAAILIPFWLYMQYIAPILGQAMSTLSSVQGQMQEVQQVGEKLSVPFSEFSGIFEKLKSIVPQGASGEQ